jgi:proteic killer suppression protein
MRIKYADEKLRRLAEELDFYDKFDRTLVRAYRMRVQLICAAQDERPLRAMKSLHFEKLKGDLDGKYSIRLNAQWRLILQIEKDETGKLIVIVSIMDYH